MDGRDGRVDSIRHREFSIVESGGSTIARDPAHCPSYLRRAGHSGKGSPQIRTTGAGHGEGLRSGGNVSSVYAKREGSRNGYALTAAKDQYARHLARAVPTHRSDQT